MNGCTLIYSGGSDSYTLLHYLLASKYDVHALSFMYGQRHTREVSYASKVCRELDVPHQILSIPIDEIVLSRALVSTRRDRASSTIPEGHYAAENMKRTVVPNRNMTMLSFATMHALSLANSYVAYGAHQGDHEIYPDCRPAFIEAMQSAIGLCDWSPCTLFVPFMSWTKTEIYRWGVQHGLDYSKTWTCYNGRDTACGRCGACVERLEAFDAIEVPDPLDYEDRVFYKSVARPPV